MMISMLNVVIDFAIKQYVVIGLIVVIGLAVLFIAFTAFKTYKDKISYDNESLPSLVDAGLDDYDDRYQEVDEEESVSAFDFADEDGSSLDDNNANDILTDANRATQSENNKNNKTGFGLFKKNKH